MRSERSVELNIPLLYVIALLGGLIFWMGIEKLFLLSIGGDGFAVSLNAVATVATILALDIPTGALADHWGRKHLLLTGGACLFLSSTVYGLSHSPKTFLIGSVLFGAAVATINGATQALTYDSLQELGKTKDYNKIHGRLQAALAVGAGFALLVSGYLAQHFGFRLNFRLAMASSAIAFALSWLLTEPKQHTFETGKPPIKVAIKESVKTVRKSKFLIAAAVLFLVTSAFRWMSDNYSQLVFSDIGIRLTWISILGFLAVGSGAIGRLVSHRFQGYTRQIVFIIIALFALVGFVSNKSIIIIGLLGFYGLNQLVQNVCESEIQDHLPSHIRATATSVFTFISTMLIVPFGLLTGVIMKRYDVFAAFKVGAVLGALALLWWTFQDKGDLELETSPDQPTTL